MQVSDEPAPTRNTAGAVGGRIVAEVLPGLLRADPDSCLTIDPAWTPTLPRHDGTGFGLADLLLFAADQLPGGR